MEKCSMIVSARYQCNSLGWLSHQKIKWTSIVHKLLDYCVLTADNWLKQSFPKSMSTTVSWWATQWSYQRTMITKDRKLDACKKLKNYFFLPVWSHFSKCERHSLFPKKFTVNNEPHLCHKTSVLASHCPICTTICTITEIFMSCSSYK